MIEGRSWDSGPLQSCCLRFGPRAVSAGRRWSGGPSGRRRRRRFCAKRARPRSAAKPGRATAPEKRPKALELHACALPDSNTKAFNRRYSESQSSPSTPPPAASAPPSPPSPPSAAASLASRLAFLPFFLRVACLPPMSASNGRNVSASAPQTAGQPGGVRRGSGRTRQVRELCEPGVLVHDPFLHGHARQPARVVQEVLDHVRLRATRQAQLSWRDRKGSARGVGVRGSSRGGGAGE